MKDLVSFVLRCVLLVSIPAFATAQMDDLKNTTPEERSGMLTKMMQSSLTLDEKTSAAVSDINLKYAKETQTLMDSSSPRLQKLMTFRQNSQAKDAELKSILTPEQYQLYEQKKSEMEATLKQKLAEKYQAGK
jgi:hypothetical protein